MNGELIEEKEKTNYEINTNSEFKHDNESLSSNINMLSLEKQN